MGSYTLSPEGRQAYDKFSAALHRAVGVPRGHEFAVDPSVVQTLYEKIEEDGNPFLKRINSGVLVTELKGEKIGMSLTGPVTSRTDTNQDGVERKARHLVNLDGLPFELFKQNMDFAIKYSRIDAWKRFKNFREMYNKLVRKGIGNDRLRIGWNGTSVGATTDPVTTPDLSDVNIGWLKLIERDAISQRDDTAFEIGGTGGPANLDVLVHEMKDLLHPNYRDDPDLVVMISRNILSTEEAAYHTAQGRRPTEKEKLMGNVLTSTYGKLPSDVPPFFPDGHIMITPYANLSVYTQEDSWRRKLEDNPKKDQYEDFNSANIGYVVEDYQAVALLTNVSHSG
uniref:Phage major capsid protein, P2 family n=1 Tax=Candidatus Kentrum sp. LFY TaxID=2126342 RepID=A0A450WI41_9GAMM|nr:MAG: phage major capsid protein, P2 family [Candidatus Kentron sp. LFY]